MQPRIHPVRWWLLFVCAVSGQFNAFIVGYSPHGQPASTGTPSRVPPLHSLESRARFTFQKPSPATTSDVHHQHVLEHVQHYTRRGRKSPNIADHSNEPNVFATIPPVASTVVVSPRKAPRILSFVTVSPNSRDHTFKNNPQHIRPHEHLAGRPLQRLRTADIKRILNLQHAPPNATLDRILELTFDLHSADPVYIFVLPAAKLNDDDADDDNEMSRDHRHGDNVDWRQQHPHNYRSQNRTLILHRSNFAAAPVYPHITPAQRRLQRTNITRLQHLIESIDTADAPKANDYQPESSLRASHFVTEDGGTVLVADSVIDEHRSAAGTTDRDRDELNFVRFLRLLNQDGQTADGKSGVVVNGNSLASVLMTDDDDNDDDRDDGGGDGDGDGGFVAIDEPNVLQPLNGDMPDILLSGEVYAPSAAANRTSVSWKDLGLEGWHGGIKEPGHSFQELTQSHVITPHHHNNGHQSLFRPPSAATTAATTYAVHHHYAYATTHKRPDHTTTTTLRTPTQNAHRHIPSGHVVVADNDDDLANALLLDAHQQQQPHNHNHNNGPPHSHQSASRPPLLTRPRSQHTDDDVFIGRANNPFGHSTKWQMLDHGNGSAAFGILRHQALPPKPTPSVATAPMQPPRAANGLFSTSSTSANAVADSSSSSSGKESSRSKRGALLLYSMIKCATGCDPLLYKGYGCYCGFLGSGRTLDGIDRCCQAHDLCYVRAKCPMFLEYFVPYLWKCYRGRPLCAIDHGEWGGPGSCASRLCECDQTLSKCLRRFHCPRKRAVCTTSPWRLLQNVIML